MDSRSQTTNFENLPGEIIFHVLLHVPDHRALFHLIRASPRASRLLRATGSAIVNDVLARSLSPQVVGLIRLFTFVLDDAERVGSAALLETCLEHFRRPAQHTLATNNLLHRHEDNSLVHQRSCLFAGQILALCCRFAQLTSICLAYFRTRCRCLRPSCLENKNDLYSDSQTPWRLEFASRSLEAVDVGPPDWVEEQRVLRALWTLRLSSELKAGAVRQCVPLRQDVVFSVDAMEIETLLKGRGSELEETLTVLQFLDRIKRCTLPTAGLLEGFGLDMDHSSGADTLDMDLGLCANVDTDVMNQVLEKGSTWWPDPAVQPFDGDVQGVNFESWSLQLSFSTDGYRAMEGALKDFYSPIRGAPRWPFRDLGVCIWSQDKMQALRLSPRCHHRFDARARSHGSRWGDQFHIWRSLLPEKILRETVETLEEQWRLAGSHKT